MTKDEGGKEDASEIRKKAKEMPSTKVVIRCLPPTLTEADFLEQISPLPDNNYLSYVKADRSLEVSAFCRAYINIINQEDILPFRDQWNGYPFTDTKGTEHPAVVEFSLYQKVPKKQVRKVDPRCGTIENDDDFKAFADSLQLQAVVEHLPSAETYLEELEAKLNDKEAQELTPLLAFLKNKKIERIKIRQEAREERRKKEREQKKRDEERRQKREEERRRQREKQRQREQEAKEKEKGKVKKEFDKEDSQKIKLLMKPEEEKRNKKEDLLAPLDEKNKGKEKTGGKDPARPDGRRKKDPNSKSKPENYQMSSGMRNRGGDSDKASNWKDPEKEQECKEREWKSEQQRAKEERTKDRDRQRGEWGGERPQDRDQDKLHDIEKGGVKNIGQDETPAVKGLYKAIDVLSKRQLQRDNIQRDSHNNRQTRQGWKENEKSKKGQPQISSNVKRLDKNNHQSASRSEEESSGRKQKKTSQSADKRPASGKESSVSGTDSREGSEEKSRKTARMKEGSAHLRNKDRPTMALYQPGQRPSVFKCQDVKEPSDKTKGYRFNSREAEIKPACQSDRTKTGTDKREGRRDCKDADEGRERASVKCRGGGKGQGLDDQWREERNQRDGKRQGTMGDQRQSTREGGRNYRPQDSDADQTSDCNKPGSSESSQGGSCSDDKCRNKGESDLAQDKGSKPTEKKDEKPHSKETA